MQEITTFECQICFDNKELREKMPESSLECGCGNNICVPCFVTDFQARHTFLYIGVGAISQWEDHTQLTRFLADVFEKEHEGDEKTDEECKTSFETYLLDHMYIGKKCPFCNQTGIWKQNRTPRVIEGRLKLYSPWGVRRNMFVVV